MAAMKQTLRTNWIKVNVDKVQCYVEFVAREMRQSLIVYQNASVWIRNSLKYRFKKFYFLFSRALSGFLIYH